MAEWPATPPTNFQISSEKAYPGQSLTCTWEPSTGDFDSYRVYGVRSDGQFTVSVYVDKNVHRCAIIFPSDIPVGAYARYHVGAYARDQGDVSSSSNFVSVYCSVPQDDITFPDGGRLERFENANGTPIFPLAILEGIFRMSDGMSLASILSSIAGGGPIEGVPGKGVPSGGIEGQLLAKASSADYDTKWVALSEDGAGTAGVTSFNNRTGAVMPAAGDYTANMVGAIPTSAVQDIQAITQADYDALSTKNPTTLYLIKE